MNQSTNKGRQGGLAKPKNAKSPHTTKSITQSWRKMHDYRGDNDRQKCLKCGRVLLAKHQKFPPTREWTDKQPACPVKDTRDLKQLLRDKDWYGFAPEAYFWVEFKPFTVYAVTLESLL